jgi:hypothetical protein
MITIKQGKIFIKKDEKDPGWELTLDYVRRDMLRSVKTSRPGSFYASKIRSLAKEIENRGLFSLKNIQDCLKTLSATKEPGVKQCCQVWLQWLSYIKMATPMNKRPQCHKDLYAENYCKIFKQA